MINFYNQIFQESNQKMAKSNLKREEIILRCEDYMLRGYDRPSELSQLLGVAYNTAREYIEIVKARWEIQGDPVKRESARAELIKKAQEVIKESWILKSNTKNNMEKISAMRVVLHAIERLTKLNGLDTNNQETPVVMSITLQRERQMSILADQINQMPDTQRQKALEMVRTEIKKRKANKEEESAAEIPEF